MFALRRWRGLAVAGLLAWGVGESSAPAQNVVVARPRANRGWGAARSQPVDPTNPAPARGLGTFYANPQAWVGGSYPVGSGYGPLDGLNGQNLSLYGPLSGLRATAVTVPTYTRGYDGRYYPSRVTSFAYPNAPELSPFVYPNQTTRVPGFPTPTMPAWRSNAANWIDQN